MRLRVTEAFHLLSTNLQTARKLVAAGVAPTLVALCSSNTESIRRECVNTLFNLSRVPGCESTLVAAGASKALMVVALLRSHQSETQRMSMQAVHNLMADESVRMQVLNQGGVFGLLKLAGAVNPVTQRVCALTMYYLVHQLAPRTALVEGGCVRSMVKALNHMACFTPFQSHNSFLPVAPTSPSAADSPATSPSRRKAAAAAAAAAISSSPPPLLESGSPTVVGGTRARALAQPSPATELGTPRVLKMLVGSSMDMRASFGSDHTNTHAHAHTRSDSRGLAGQHDEELVGNMLTGVLSTVCKHGGNTSLLINEGVIPTLVTLCRYFRARLAQGEQDRFDDELERVLQAENGVVGGVDPGLSSPPKLLANCVWGLCVNRLCGCCGLAFGFVRCCVVWFGLVWFGLAWWSFGLVIVWQHRHGAIHLSHGYLCRTGIPSRSRTAGCTVCGSFVVAVWSCSDRSCQMRTFRLLLDSCPCWQLPTTCGQGALPCCMLCTRSACTPSHNGACSLWCTGTTFKRCWSTPL